MMSLHRREFLGIGATALAAAIAEGLPAEKKAVASRKTAAVKTGGIELIPIDGGKYRVWTKKVGSGPIKMLTLHGGPGATHEYFEVFDSFFPGPQTKIYVTR